MVFKNSYSRIVVRTILLFVLLTIAAFFLVKQLWLPLALVLPVLVYQLYDFLKFQKKTQNELTQFVESVHYRYFSHGEDGK